MRWRVRGQGAEVERALVEEANVKGQRTRGMRTRAMRTRGLESRGRGLGAEVWDQFPAWAEDLAWGQDLNHAMAWDTALELSGDPPWRLARAPD